RRHGATSWRFDDGHSLKALSKQCYADSAQSLPDPAINCESGKLGGLNHCVVHVKQGAHAGHKIRGLIVTSPHLAGLC
ncbi:hypothetical protein, partial [Psychrobacter sp. W2-37-MNA-CIBAN-0211]|uniref:hypothetical protein n=1 Tax=Psychrobacter sp. W2-37-MNA-CIBAN-0211 TaxID=3140443 RepID=UPI00332F4D87